MIKLPYLEHVQTEQDTVSWKQMRCPLVYFFVADNGMVLYVGRTDKFATRWKQHIASDKALHLVQRIELHIMDSDAEAHFYEAEMILKFAPLWNAIGRRAKPSKIAVQPLGVVHYKATAFARYVLPYVRSSHPSYECKHYDHGKKTEITVYSKTEYVTSILGVITVKNDLSEMTIDHDSPRHYFVELVKKIRESIEGGKSLRQEEEFVPVAVPDKMTKSLWDGAVARERSKDWLDYSEYDETGIVHELPSVRDYLLEIDHASDIDDWYTPKG